MADSFANAAYYEEVFGSPPARVGERLQEELARASRYVRRECPGIDARVLLHSVDPTDPDALDPDVVADVVCEMVQAASASPGGPGISSLQEGAGPFQQTMQFTNPVGDLYLSKKQKRLLGYGAVAFTVPLGRVT